MIYSLQGKVKLNEHAVFTYYSPEIALAVSLELLIRSIDSGAALIVIRSPQQIEDILQALSSAGYDPQKLIQSKRLVTISNEIYLAVRFFCRFCSPNIVGYSCCKESSMDFGYIAKSLT